MKELSTPSDEQVLEGIENDTLILDAAFAELDAWNSEDEAFMELAAKQEAIKRGEVAVSSAQTMELVDELEADERRENIKPSLGAYANAAVMGAFATSGGWFDRLRVRREERQAKYAAKEGDSRLESIYKSFRRGQEKILGGFAVATLVAVEGVLLYNRVKGIDFDSPLKHYNYNTLAHTTSYEFGGRGDSTADMMIDAKRANGDLVRGTNYIGVKYPATIAPVDAGPSLDQSTNMGADAAFNDYLSKKGTGQQIYAEGFSEGSISALKFAQKVQADNGGTLPSNFHLVLEGSPVTSSGFFQSATAQNPMLKPMLQTLGINPDTGPVPAGTIARYSQNDIWGNGNKQSLLGQGVMVLDMPNSHVIEDVNNPHVVWVDSAGVIHEEYDVGVHPFTQMIQANNGAPVNAGFNDFFNDIVPINSGVNGSELAGPNANAAINDFARGIDMETGNSGIPQKILAATPESWRRVMQDGLDLANSGPDKIMQDPAKAMDVYNDVNNMIGDVFKAMPTNSQAPVKDFINGAINNVAPGQAQQINSAINPIIDNVRSNIVTAPAPSNPVIPALPPSGNVNLDNVINQGTKIFNNTIHQIQQAAPAPAPAPAPVVPAPAPVFNLPPAPMPAPAGPPAPDMAQAVNQGMQMANNLLGGLFAPKR